MTTLVFKELTSGRTQVVQVGRLLVAGFTGRDEDSVAEHVQELAELGVPVPDNTPTLYRLDPELAHQTTAAVVSGSNTSGEVEPVEEVRLAHVLGGAEVGLARADVVPGLG